VNMVSPISSSGRLPVLVVGAAVLLCFFFLEIPHPGNQPAMLDILNKAQVEDNMMAPPQQQEEQQQHSKNFDSLLEYSTNTVLKMAKQLSVVAGKLLIYDPAEDQFFVYTVSPNATTLYLKICPRCPNELRVIIQALIRLRPLRFKPDQKPFQLFWTNRDFTFTSCAPESCFTHPSWLHFGSYYRNRSLLPNIQMRPNYDYLRCVHEVQMNPSFSDGESCTAWNVTFATEDAEFDSLIPKIVWRGNDRPCLPHIAREYFVGNWTVPYLPFNPRDVAVKLSMNNYTSWMHVSFGSKSGQKRFNQLTNEEQARFKYHVDFGGTGGTTWTGTLEKLAMPGCLFHHETPAQDWYFDQLIPWKHYVPIRTDLSDLKQQFEWAESHPQEAKQISRQGTEFARYMFSKTHLVDELEHYFGESSLGSLVDAYQPDVNETRQSILSEYQSQQVHLFKVSWCNYTHCQSILRPSGWTYVYSTVNRSECSTKSCVW